MIEDVTRDDVRAGAFGFLCCSITLRASNLKALLRKRPKATMLKSIHKQHGYSAVLAGCRQERVPLRTAQASP